MSKLKSRFSRNEKSFRKKTKCSCFAWAQILVGLCVPIAITIYTIIQSNNENSIAEQNRQQDVDLANQTRLNDLSIADNRDKEVILNNYIKFLSKYLQTNNLSGVIEESSRSILQFHTLSVLSQLDSKRKSYLIRCLLKNNLITHRLNDNSLIDLNSANLRNLNFLINPFIQTPLSVFTCVNVACTDLTQSSFENNLLSGSHFHHSLMIKANLRSTIAHIIYCNDNNHIQTSFKRALLFQSIFTQSIYYGVTFADAIMNNSLLEQMQCVRCDFTGASMIECNLSYSKFQFERNLGYEPPKDVKSLFIRTDLTDAILYQTIFETTDFQEAILIRSNATQAHFLYCNLSNVTMNNCILTESKVNHSKFILSNLNNCRINRVQMFNVDFSYSSLVNVDFSHSQCHSCLFNGANLTQTNFYNTSLDGSYFQNTIFNHQQLIRARSIVGIHL